LTPVSYQLLIDQLRTASSREVRHMAALILGEVAHPADIVPAVECALADALRRPDEDRVVRLAAMLSLSKLGTTKALHALTDVVLDGQDRQAVTLALHLLKKLDRPAVVRELVDIAHDLTTGSTERSKAANALGVLGGDERLVPPALLETLTRDPSAKVRAAAATALGVYREDAISMRKPGGVVALQIELETLVMAAIDDDHVFVRIAVAAALGRIAAAAEPRRGCLTWLRTKLDKPGTVDIWRCVVRQFESAKKR
jgi:HEAT repeat protein